MTGLLASILGILNVAAGQPMLLGVGVGTVVLTDLAMCTVFAEVTDEP